MKELNLSHTCKLPADIGTETIAILGRRGSGKSNTGTVLMEELISAGQQVVLIDPKGEGWGLKAQGSGGAGLDVIVFGEPEGDLPLRELHADTIAEFVVHSGRSCVLSLAGFESDAAARRFVARFAEQLVRLKRKPEHHTPLMVVIEEAHLFVPQNVAGPMADMVSQLQKLVRLGRSWGIGTTLVDQRPASVNKDVLTQIELMICHQLTAPHDRKAVDAWIEANAEPKQAKEFRATLPTLQSGEAWIWSPAKLKLFERIKVRRRHTFDSGSTPVLGRDLAKRPAMRKVDLDALRGDLERVVEEKKANDPAHLKKQIAELQGQLRSQATTAPAVSVVEKHVITDRQIERLEKLQRDIQERMDRWWGQAVQTANPILDLIKQQSFEVASLLNAARAAKSGSVQMTPAARQSASARTPDTAPVPQALAGGDDTLDKPTQKILRALAWWKAIGVDRPRLAQMAAIAEYAVGGTLSTYLGRMAGAGLIERDRGEVWLTADGAKRAPRVDSPPSLAELHLRVLGVLDGPGRTILAALLRYGKDGTTTEQLGADSGYAVGGTFSTYLGRLSSREFIERSRGMVRPTAVLFPEGLR